MFSYLCTFRKLTVTAKVEFYFGDANLPTDNFMWELTDGSTNLPVSIKKICLFGRMKRFQPYEEIVAALRESPFLEVTGAEGQEEVKRRVPYDPTVPRNKTEARSVYVKGFGEEEPSSQFDIEAFFAPYGPTNAVRLRRSDDKLFKGSVFVEFADEETAKKFLALDPKPLWKSKHELDIKSKKEYIDIKQQEIKDGKLEPRETWAPRGRGRGNRGSRGNNSRGGRGGRERGDRDPDDWKKRREEDRATGFKDDKRRNDQRGGRGNQRGGRRGGRDDRGPRNNDRNRENEGGDVYELLSLLLQEPRLTSLLARGNPKERRKSLQLRLSKKIRQLQLKMTKSVLAKTTMEGMRPQPRRLIPSPKLLLNHDTLQI